MSKTLKDRLDYLIALVSEFAATHHLSLQQAYLYLQQYKGLDFADEFYDVDINMLAATTSDVSQQILILKQSDNLSDLLGSYS